MVRDEAKATLVRGASTTAPVVCNNLTSNTASKPAVRSSQCWHERVKHECLMHVMQAVGTELMLVPLAP